MNEKPTIEVGKVPVITKFIYTLGVLPTSYLMSMTYQEQVTWLCNYIQTSLIPQINEDVEAIQELQNLYELLRTYVNDYFDNLDVQEEINNKLDEMIESGELEEIISSYISPYLDSFNERLTVQDNKINSIESLDPIPVSSTNDMTDTTKIYLNITDGYWYYYNGTSWVQGGLYQSLELTDNFEDGIQLSYEIPKFDNSEFVINTLAIRRQSIKQSDGDITDDQNGTRLRTGRLATSGNDSRGIVAVMKNTNYLVAPRWYSDGTTSDWKTVYIEGYDFTNDYIYIGKHPYCAFAFKKSDDSVITDEDIVNIRNNFKLYLLTDKTLTENNVPADAKAVGEAIRNYTPYNPYQSGMINFNVKVNKNILINDESDTYTEETVKSVLMLPTTYQAGGEKTKLIMCCHGANGTITNNNWYNSNWMVLINYLLSKGYAVFDANRLNEIRDGFGKTYGSPVALESLYKAYKYIINNYNIDEKIYIHGTSMGGTTAQAFAYAYPTIIRACTCFAPANTCYSLWRSGDNIRIDEDANLIANCFGYETRTEAKTDEYRNLIGYCTALKIQRFNNNNELINTNILDLENAIENNYQGGFWFNNNEKWFLDFPVPIKIWNGSDDESVQNSFNECIINAIRNSGGIGYIKEVNGANHTQTSYGQIGNMRDEMIYFLQRY